MSLISALPRPKRLIPCLLSFFLLPTLALALITLSSTVRAQEGDSSGRPTKEAQELLDALDDIDVLRSLTPLKLKPDQLDKLITAITTAKADYNKKVSALASDAVVKMADDIRSMHKEVLAGKTTPKEFDDRVKKLQTEFLTQRDVLNGQNILRMSGAVSAIFTDTQRAAVVKMEKDVMQKLGIYQSGTAESKLFNAYVVDLFINTGRIVPILKDLKAATEAK